MSEDNLAPLVTQCPNCTTRFKVTEGQLQVAGGRVRCGACLTVFEGTAHLHVDGEPIAPSGSSQEVDAVLDELERSPAAADAEPRQPAREQAAAQADAPPQVNDKDFATTLADASALSDDELPADLAALEAEFLADLRGEPASAADPAPDADPAPAADSMPPETQQGDSWVDEASDDVWPLPAADETVEIPASADAAADPAPGTPPLQPAGAEAERDPPQEVAGPADDPSPRQASPADESEPFAQGQRPAEAETEAVAQPVGAAHAAAAAEAAVLQSAAVDVPPVDLPGKRGADKPNKPQFAVEPETEAKARPWVTWILIALAVIGLPAQVLWFQYESWVTDLTFRPVYQLMCNVAGCELPPMRDAKLIESRKSVSRSLPQQPDTRVVDVLMVNNADFAQPFPVVQVSFSTMNGQLVASRRFQPEEYLRGDMAKVRLMPPRTPIHVSLQLKDPGPEAQNFRVQFH